MTRICLNKALQRTPIRGDSELNRSINQHLTMTEKNKIFLTYSQALKEILDDFKYDPEQYELFAKVYSFLVGGKATPGEEECPPITELRY